VGDRIIELLYRNLQEVFGEGDAARRRAAGVPRLLRVLPVRRTGAGAGSDEPWGRPRVGLLEKRRKGGRKRKRKEMRKRGWKQQSRSARRQEHNRKR